MKFWSWKIWLGLSLLGLSAVLYLLNYLIFRDVNYMTRLFLAQLGFLPISVLLVTIIINQLLAQRAKAAKLGKLNMVIGAFFSEVGATLLKMISGYDRNLGRLRQEIHSRGHWSEPDLDRFRRGLASHDFHLSVTGEDVVALRDFLSRKRDFLLRLLENPNLLEHEAFANLLLAVFHLTEELSLRQDLQHLTPEDREHLAGDLERGYALLTGEWLAYMRHLQSNYPYLFSLALRTNPFDPQASPEIK